MFVARSVSRKRTAPAWGLIAVGPAGLLCAALLGTWVGHGAEYLRVWGAARFPAAMTRSAHAYLGPTGIVLVVLGACAVYASLRLARRLERQVRRLRAVLLGAPDREDEAVPSGWFVRFPTLVALLWTVQLALYVAQENLEAHAFGLPAPGFGAVSGVHAFAPLVHLAVAALAAAAVWLTRRRVTELAAEARWAAGRITHRREARADLDRRPHVRRAWTPAQRWGMALWARPPPAPVA